MKDRFLALAAKTHRCCVFVAWSSPLPTASLPASFNQAHAVVQQHAREPVQSGTGCEIHSMRALFFDECASCYTPSIN